MQPADIYYRLLRLFSEKPCVKMGEFDKKVIEELMALGVVYSGIPGDICIKSVVRLATAAIRMGCDPARVSTYLSWKDFESFVAEALLESGYEVLKNLRFGVRKWEFDVLAMSIPSSLGLVVDCKHWSPRYSSESKIRWVSLSHMEKLRRFLDLCGYELSNYPSLRKIREFIGLIVTISESFRGSVQGIGVVPVYYFRDFMSNIRHYIEELKIATLRNPCYIQASR